MVKRIRISLEDVACHDSLCLAFWRAARGKRDQPGVNAVERSVDRFLERLGAQIIDRSLAIEPPVTFMIRDPKPRLIHAPPFRERVLHHALMEKVGPVLDRSLVDDTFACRKGKGTLAAVRRAQHHLRRFRWYVKTDISSYFASVDHVILKQMLRRRIKGNGVLWLCDLIIDSYEAKPGNGLPIGALTSQHFANFYLGLLGRFLLEGLGVRGMVRYMDDTVWWLDDRDACRSSLQTVAGFLEDRLCLRLKSNVQIQRSRHGLAFCGYRLTAGSVRMSRRRCRRYVQSRKRWESAYRRGLISELELQTGYDAARAITDHSAARSWRRRQLVMSPAIDI